MSQLHLPWLELTVLIPLLGGALVARIRHPPRARRWCVRLSGLTLVCATAAWLDFAWLGATEATDRWDVLTWITGSRWLLMDEFSAPLVPMVALLYFLTTLATQKTKLRRFSFASSLISEGIRLMTFASTTRWLIVLLLALGVIPPYLELRARGRSTRIFLVHMLAFVGLMFVGWGFAEAEGEGPVHSWWAIGPLLAAILIRSGMIPVHCWMSDLFENATFGTALLFVLPLTGAYAAVRLVLPVAPDWVLQSIGLISLATVVYAAGMALVQTEARRFFCYLFLSHSALVFVGLEVVNKIGLTGALCVWLSTSFSLGGLGLTLRALEARFGRLSLLDFHGLYEHSPTLAICFALTGLASVGFPGTLGYVGTEMLVDGAVEAYPHVGVALVIAAAFNGIAVVRAYFWLFTGTRHASSVSLGIMPRERLAVLLLAALILGGGIFPQPGVASRFHAAGLILQEREARHLSDQPAMSVDPE
ncbi:MAG: proton-conducting transporter membrane subunit [Planctomycetales bacterium]